MHEELIDDKYSNLVPLPAQQLLLNAVQQFIDIPYFFFIGGYGCGKSFCLRLMLLYFLKKYEDRRIKIIVCGTTLGDIQKFVLDDFFIYLTVNRIPYIHDKKLNLVYIGKTTIALVPTEDPTRVYGHTADIALVDEVDELKPEIAELFFKALAERVRGKNLPDRQPFSMFFTTAQGKRRGMYAKIQQLKETNQKYIIVRGRTEDNNHNAKSYVNNLKAIYTEEEQKAFLNGHFIDFNNGLVYSDFREDMHIIAPFEVDPTDTVFIGQDKNVGYNKAVCKIKRDKKLYTVKEFSTQSIQDVPRIVRGYFPLNDILWYPDVTALDIIGAYSKEIREYDIRLQVGAVNPSILTRIFVVNKMYKTGRSYVFKTCKELITAHSSRSFDDKGMPEKQKGEKCPSHICDADEYVTWRVVMHDPDFSDMRVLAQRKERN